MRFPIKVTRQKRCPICKSPVPDLDDDSSEVPASGIASLCFQVMSYIHGRSYPVYLGSHMTLGWDTGVVRHPQSRTSLGASLSVAEKDEKTADAGNMQIQFCSTRCMRHFFKQAIDELERRIAVVKPEVKAVLKAKSKQPRKSDGSS
jgi:hypothetical protein